MFNTPTKTFQVLIAMVIVLDQSEYTVTVQQKSVKKAVQAACTYTVRNVKDACTYMVQRVKNIWTSAIQAAKAVYSHAVQAVKATCACALKGVKAVCTHPVQTTKDACTGCVQTVKAACTYMGQAVKTKADTLIVIMMMVSIVAAVYYRRMKASAAAAVAAGQAKWAEASEWVDSACEYQALVEADLKVAMDEAGVPRLMQRMMVATRAATIMCMFSTAYIAALCSSVRYAATAV